MSTFSSWHEVSAPEQRQLGVDTYTFTAGYQNLSSAYHEQRNWALKSDEHS